MLEKIIEFITPGPLSEKFEFRMRVLTSWISLGLALGIIMSIAMSLDASNSNIKAPNGQLVLILQLISSVTIMYCLSGFMGMGVSIMRGDKAEYSGWYWWLLPTVGFLVTGFYLAMFILGFIFTLFGISSPTPSINYGRRVTNNERKKQIRKEIQKKQAKEFLEEYEQLLKQSPSIQQPILERIILKVRNAPPGARLEDVLSKEDILELMMMLIEKKYAN